MMALADHPFSSLPVLLPPMLENPALVNPAAPPSPLVNGAVTTTQPTNNSNLGDGRTATGVIGDSGPRPSGAPRAKGEVSPSSLISADPVTIRAGAVWAGEGLQIHPVVPRPSVGMIYSVPSNPLVRLTFNHAGEVVAARFVRRTGSDVWDEAILAASYRWTASGKKLALIGRDGTEQEFVWILGSGGDD
jgi:hypothetical protein